ncbi:MAG: type I-C CRISPR-associated protein Cas8c/Csd1 [Thiothrix sp.]|nr:type I-C CRISPR-associated protein Cas8c/Csd1 [Thiothrix sp.]HPQ94899.1 type I-C CRISPR-associated protein Cas8c/Csd1 [Thiolinea sp.]
MILQALQAYYQRKLDEQDPAIAPFGFQQQELPFIIEVDAEGHLVQIADTREGVGKQKTTKPFLVPQGVKKTSGIASNLLWDNAEYVLGIVTKGKPERVKDQHQAFIDRIYALPATLQEDAGIKAVLAFLDQLDLTALEKLPAWEELQTNPNLGLRLSGDPHLVCQRPALIDYLQQPGGGDPANQGLCLLSGENTEIERLHTAIKGVWGAQTSGANIVSFNLDAFNSFGKKQGTNAPVGKQAVFAYTTGLNHLLRKGSPQRIQVGDASTVFWAEKESEFEQQFPSFFSDSPKDEPDKGTKAVKSLYESIQHGLLNSDEGGKRFYVLGLAPNAARIAIRFWETATVGKLAQRIAQHFDDLEIVHSDKALPHLPLFRLLLSTAMLRKADNIPPNLAGDTIRSILTGLPYPQTLLSAAVRRNRAEQQVSYERAALIKACINRQTRSRHPDRKEELLVSLDTENTNPGYRLGRLFATLEKIQEEANPGLNATIRDRYYGAASANPVTVFATLLKLKNHHLSKMDNKGRVTNLERLLGQIMDGLDSQNPFPSTLKLADQGRFAVGYYHQRQDFFKKREKTPATEITQPTTAPGTQSATQPETQGESL